MRKKRQHIAAAVTGKQDGRTRHLTAKPDAAVISLLIPLLDRVEDAFPAPNYLESQLANSTSPTESPKKLT